MKVTTLICLLLLAGCAPTFEVVKATSIEDYCHAVALEAVDYESERKRGKTQADVRLTILNGIAPRYDQREVDKMLEVVELVFSGYTGAEIYQDCVRRRTDGTWFPVRVDGGEAKT